MDKINYNIVPFPGVSHIAANDAVPTLKGSIQDHVSHVVSARGLEKVQKTPSADAIHLLEHTVLAPVAKPWEPLLVAILNRMVQHAEQLEDIIHDSDTAASVYSSIMCLTEKRKKSEAQAIYDCIDTISQNPIFQNSPLMKFVRYARETLEISQAYEIRQGRERFM